MHGFTISLAQENAKFGITVNTVSPGYIGTDMVMAVPEEVRDKIVAQIPTGRLGEPDEIAYAVGFFIPDEARWITGANLAAMVGSTWAGERRAASGRREQARAMLNGQFRQVRQPECRRIRAASASCRPPVNGRPEFHTVNSCCCCNAPVLHCAMLPPGIVQSVAPWLQLRIIKKYPNRRLYDTEISSYITIEDVRQLIVDGEEFEVRDAKTGEDLTRRCCCRSSPSTSRTGEPMLSTQLLSQIIRFYGDSLQGFMGSYLGALDADLPRAAAAVPPADGRHARPDAVDDDEPADRAQHGAVEGIPAEPGAAANGVRAAPEQPVPKTRPGQAA